MRHFQKIMEKTKLGDYINTEKSIINIKEKIQELFKKVIDIKFNEFSENLSEIFKITSLQIIDELWTEHLESMTDLREGIGLLGYAQRDPLVEYKNNAFSLFENFMNKVNSQIIKRLLRIKRVVQQRNLLNRMNTNADKIADVLTGSREMSGTAGNASTNEPIINKPLVNQVKVGRNDPCPCGSGLKYKKCGMINAPQHKG